MDEETVLRVAYTYEQNRGASMGKPTGIEHPGSTTDVHRVP